MNIEFRNIDENFRDLKAVEDIYLEAFPELYDIPYSIYLEFVKNGDGYILAAYDEEKLVGYIAYLICREGVFVENFAVSKDLRDKGYGSQILSKFIDRFREQYPNINFFLEVEEPSYDAPNLEQRKKRIAFYERLGFVMTDIKDDFLGIIYITMTTMNPIDKETLNKLKVQVDKIYNKYKQLQ